jgi:para-aminobenzoate synthetase component 1
MRQIKKLRWQNPLKFAGKIAENYTDDWVFLYSGLSKSITDSKSYIAVFPQNKISGDDFSLIKNLSLDQNARYFGYFSYELAHNFEELPVTKKSFIALPQIYLVDFAVILEFDHDQLCLTAFFSEEKLLKKILSWSDFSAQKPISVKKLNSNFTDESYLAAVEKIKKMIAAGDLYQTNLTRKFFGEFSKKLSAKQSFQLFQKLAQLSPGNYSSFLKLDNAEIISSSPELFLSVAHGQIASQPIKGTAARSKDLKQDVHNKNLLKNSAKERAENLMIVDLVRNDLSRICAAGSVTVDDLFKINSYKTVHHMSSRVTGKLRHNIGIAEILQSTFPPGSMTGAPKIKAMDVAGELEKINRGIYSGAIGLLGREELNLSVVIRTLIVSGNKFEFQVGGAITFDSDPQMELEETRNKMRAIANLLKLS